MKDLSVVVPCYNSEQTLEELFTRIRGFATKHALSFETIFVDDFSHDQTWFVVEQLKSRNPSEVRGVKLAKNSGQHHATLCGIVKSDATYTVTIDDDLQIPPEEIEKLLERSKESNAELVYGVFPTKHHSWFRNLGSSAINGIAKKVFQTKVNGSSFRLLNRTLVNRLRDRHQVPPHLDGLLFQTTSLVTNTPVQHLPRTKGTSGYTLARLFAMALTFIFQHSTLPLQFITWSGLTLALFSFSFGCLLIFRRLIYDIPIGYTSLIVTVLFSTGLMMFFMGILGYYLKRVLSALSESDVFSIQREI